jgi:hypothetical protein
MSFVFNIDSSAKRMFCSGIPHAINIPLLSLLNNKLNFKFLTCQPTDLLASKNVVPHCEYSRYLTVNQPNVAANGTADIVSQALQLSQIPKRIFIFCRKPITIQTIKDSNTYFAIEKINVNFNNLDGILSRASIDDLYGMSVRNGSKQDMYEFLGKALNVNGRSTSTAGSILIINPARDLHCPDYLSNNSTGQFSLQFTVGIRNTDSAAVAPKLLVIVENDALFITQAGQSFKQTSLLTKEIVMNSTMSQFVQQTHI